MASQTQRARYVRARSEEMQMGLTADRRQTAGPVSDTTDPCAFSCVDSLDFCLSVRLPFSSQLCACGETLQFLSQLCAMEISKINGFERESVLLAAFNLMAQGLGEPGHLVHQELFLQQLSLCHVALSDGSLLDVHLFTVAEQHLLVLQELNATVDTASLPGDCIELSASLLLTATVVPHTSRAADFTGNSHQRWDARGAYTSGSELNTPTSCPVKLRPSGQCGAEEEGDCPYQITLPPLTIQLPKQFKLLEKTMKELQSLKEVVNKLKSGCQECRGARGSGAFGHQQADQLQRDGGEEMRLELTGQEPQDGSSQDVRGDGPTVKLNRMSASLRNARSQISALQGRLEGLNLLNMDNVQAMVDRRVENITGVVNKLSSTCTTHCPVQNAPQFILAPRDCSDYNVLETRKNGVYRVTPDARNGTFEVFCDMESFGGGWTVIQQRLNGSVSFNRTWTEYKKGFEVSSGWVMTISTC
ncbi:hypothetical protein INR49_026626 [Caranx melampygus]|nr:hypothetical protein INR49_026626 [Caranx melampygus]